MGWRGCPWVPALPAPAPTPTPSPPAHLLTPQESSSWPRCPRQVGGLQPWTPARGGPHPPQPQCGPGGAPVLPGLWGQGQAGTQLSPAAGVLQGGGTTAASPGSPGPCPAPPGRTHRGLLGQDHPCISRGPRLQKLLLEGGNTCSPPQDAEPGRPRTLGGGGGTLPPGWSGSPSAGSQCRPCSLVLTVCEHPWGPCSS